MSEVSIFKYFNNALSGRTELRRENISDLIRKFQEVRGTDEENVYMAAIMVHYWPKIGRMAKKTYPYTTFEDAYDWMVEAIMESINYSPWTDPTNKLYNDPNGPDKVINRIVQGIRANWFQAQNYDKRKINFGILSTDQFIDEYEFEPEWQPIIENRDDDSSGPVATIVRSFIDELLYEKAFILDLIIYDNAESENDLVKTMSEGMDTNYLEQFADRYGYALDEVKEFASYITKLDKTELRQRIKTRLDEFRKKYNVKDLLFK